VTDPDHDGLVIEELQGGHQLRGHIIRRAKVVVGEFVDDAAGPAVPIKSKDEPKPAPPAPKPEPPPVAPAVVVPSLPEMPAPQRRPHRRRARTDGTGEGGSSTDSDEAIVVEDWTEPTHPGTPAAALGLPARAIPEEEDNSGTPRWSSAMPPACSSAHRRPLRPHAVPPPPLPTGSGGRDTGERGALGAGGRQRDAAGAEARRQRLRCRGQRGRPASAHTSERTGPAARPDGTGARPARSLTRLRRVPTIPPEPAVPRPPTPTSPGVAAPPPAGGGRGLAAAAVAGTALLLVAAIGWWALSRRTKPTEAERRWRRRRRWPRPPPPPWPDGDHGRRDGRGAVDGRDSLSGSSFSDRGRGARNRSRRGDTGTVPTPAAVAAPTATRPAPPTPAAPVNPVPGLMSQASRPWPRSATATRSRDSTTC
jgi:hypothetical protein